MEIETVVATTASEATAPILQVDPGAFYRHRRNETLAAMARVVDSGWFILGAEVSAFEQEFSRHAGVEHGIGVASGTDAVALALRALGVGAGDRVATVSHTAVATVAAIEMTGAQPLLLDISPTLYTLQPQHLADVLAAVPPVKAVVVVHLYGQVADVPAIAAIAARYGASVIEDCAQAHGASLNGRPVGSMGAAGCFSFYPTKNLGALGDGGMVVTADAELAARLRSLREYGWQQRYVSDSAGVNSRLDEVQAALLRMRLPHLAAANRRRAGIASAYDAGLAQVRPPRRELKNGGSTPTSLQLPAAQPGGQHVYHQYVVRHPERDRLRAHLARRGIQTNVHYPLAVHQQPAYRGRIPVAPGGLPHTETAAREVLSLPMYPELDDAAVARVIDAIVGFA